MKIVIASDHAGYSQRMKIIQNLKLSSQKVEIKDLGCNSLAPSDYTEYAEKLCNFMKENSGYVGILICGSGIGMSMAANRHKHIRCALCRSSDDAIMSRNHNDANVLALGERFTGSDIINNIIHFFLTSEFDGGRHQERINQIS